MTNASTNARLLALPAARRRAMLTTAALAATLALTACSLQASGGGEASGGSSDDASDGGAGTVTLVTHDSFNISEETLAAFEAESGYDVVQVAPGDGGSLVNQLILTKDSPLGDVVYGIDNSFASRAVNEGVLEPYVSTELPASAEAYLLGDELTPINRGDVCLNIDTGWFAEAGLTPPSTLEDIADPAYKGLTVVTNPATSSPGLAFLLATVGAFGEDGWEQYWADLRANDVSVVDGWSDAYYVDFSGADGAGPRPIVLSYSSSPAFTVNDAGESTTAALLDTCFRQVEYAGVISGAANPEGAQALIDFLLGEKFQSEVPEQMYVYPIDDAVELPAEWASFAPLATAPFEVSPEDIDANRDAWITAWTATVID